MKYTKYILLLTLFIVSISSANNLAVSSVTTTGQDVTAGTDNAANFVLVQFDISWENSFRDATNWDAAWVFVKYKNSNGVWAHATLNTTGYTAPTGSTVSPASDQKGAFIYRDATGTGTFSLSSAQLRWNYGTDGVADNETVTVKVFAIEMIYVPTGNFQIGDAGSNYRFRQSSSEAAVSITNSLVANINSHTNNSYDDNQIESPGIGIDGDGGIDTDNNGSIDNADFPTGYTKFYCMKYETTQEQYVDFLNSLTRAQQEGRTNTSLASGTTSISNRYVMSNTTTLTNRNGIRCDATIHTSDPIIFYCDYDGNDTGNETTDGQNIACNFLNEKDALAYSDWAGLRPMTELEFEKACRGGDAVKRESAWGTTNTNTTTLTFANEGEASEQVATNYSTSSGNTTYSLSGPVRVGIFAANANNTGRETSGATYYGIMEMTGNLYERCVTVGNSTGRSFTGLHGNGELDTNGDPDVSNWPISAGLGLKGGTYGGS